MPAVNVPPATFSDVDALSDPTVEVPIVAEGNVAEVVAVIEPTVSDPIELFALVIVPVTLDDDAFAVIAFAVCAYDDVALVEVA